MTTTPPCSICGLPAVVRDLGETNLCGVHARERLSSVSAAARARRAVRPSSSEAVAALAAADARLVEAARLHREDPIAGELALRQAEAERVRAELLLLASSGDREALRILVDERERAA